jgi:hypothetical protein
LIEKGNNCSQIFNPPNFDLTPNVCKTINTGTTAFSAPAVDLIANNASCPANGPENVPELEWGLNAKSCKGTLDACSGGQCVPSTGAPYADACVWAEGDTTCPGGFSDRYLFHADVDDTRGCSECTCGKPTGTCGGSITLTDGCGNLPLAYGSVTPGGACKDIGNTIPKGAKYSPEIDAECEASGGEAEGEATPTGTITFCCGT